MLIPSPTTSLFLSSLIYMTVALDPKLKTTIHSSNGTDITSSFQTMVYWAPEPGAIVPTPGLTGREQEDQTIRYLNDCSSPTARFIGSLCQYKADIAGSMQQYLIYCQERPQAPGPYRSGYGTNPPIFERSGEPGACESDEVCMPTKKGLVDGMRYYTAACVKKSSFQTDDWARKIGTSGESSLGNRTASAVLSEQQGQTPLEASLMEISAVEAKGTVQEKNCTDCVEIRTAPLPEKAKSLNLQAWLEGEKVRTLQVAGVLYLLINAIG